MLLTGCGLVAFGPSLVLSTTVLTHANLTAIALSAALFWITSLLATAIIWTFLPLSPSFLNIVVVLGGSVVQVCVHTHVCACMGCLTDLSCVCFCLCSALACGCR